MTRKEEVATIICALSKNISSNSSRLGWTKPNELTDKKEFDKMCVEFEKVKEDVKKLELYINQYSEIIIAD